MHGLGAWSLELGGLEGVWGFRLIAEGLRASTVPSQSKGLISSRFWEPEVYFLYMRMERKMTTTRMDFGFGKLGLRLGVQDLGA